MTMNYGDDDLDSDSDSDVIIIDGPVRKLDRGKEIRSSSTTINTRSRTRELTRTTSIIVVPRSNTTVSGADGPSSHGTRRSRTRELGSTDASMSQSRARHLSNCEEDMDVDEVGASPSEKRSRRSSAKPASALTDRTRASKGSSSRASTTSLRNSDAAGTRRLTNRSLVNSLSVMIVEEDEDGLPPSPLANSQLLVSPADTKGKKADKSRGCSKTPLFLPDVDEEYAGTGEVTSESYIPTAPNTPTRSSVPSSRARNTPHRARPVACTDSVIEVIEHHVHPISRIAVPRHNQQHSPSHTGFAISFDPTKHAGTSTAYSNLVRTGSIIEILDEPATLPESGTSIAGPSSGTTPPQGVPRIPSIINVLSSTPSIQEIFVDNSQTITPVASPVISAARTPIASGFTHTPSIIEIPQQATPTAVVSGSSNQQQSPHEPSDEVIPRPNTPFMTVALATLMPASDSSQSALPPPPEDLPSLESSLLRVLEIVPNVQPEHAISLLNTHIVHAASEADGPATHDRQIFDVAVQRVLHALFEDSNYPKMERGKGKGKRKSDVGSEGSRGAKRSKIDYGNKDRPFAGGPSYHDLAIEQLMVDFPYVPKNHIRNRLVTANYFYAPTYLLLAEDTKAVPCPYRRKSAPYRSKGKGQQVRDDEFAKERNWLLEKINGVDPANDQDGQAGGSAVGSAANEAAADTVEELEECEDGVECGCCFSRYAFEHMVQCPDAHLFCKPCMVTYASNLLGSHNHLIICMDQSGCKLSFSMSELQRFLTSKLFDLYHRVKQSKEIELAELEGLEECPFCEYKCVIENEGERLFRCENVEVCGIVSCRECKKEDHLPKSCKEIEAEKHLDGQHAVEEAMSQALVRNCPKCKKAFIKESGCNKMTCPNCHTLSCYICRQVITGYDHFDLGQGRKCILHDPVERRAAQEVEAAAKKALREYKEANPDIDENAIKVDIPKVPKTQQQPLLQPMQFGAFAQGIGPYGVIGAGAAHLPLAGPVAGLPMAMPQFPPYYVPMQPDPFLAQLALLQRPPLPPPVNRRRRAR